jgi:hypothetical protein
MCLLWPSKTVLAAVNVFLGSLAYYRCAMVGWVIISYIIVVTNFF